ncbi:hypothetical protein PUNSTDRAFT_130905 [Punctularia strigosozonata HHB-11173 SS5]|uniref:uncharacterized protein n=1 Tax=Punctularia strigosozonata (strain HHB-11173) TaxID=741275 RepID=UPI0004417866|nr:uncharacterized protein PUNSTDRAFT_130905 [Punctularia strigosozonata HHB-11173 SS5]EIN12648.1 hypothetical protein PUNSTDRAFT_130905 [Punctularia strigosozonata HHB-11173 SS5]
MATTNVYVEELQNCLRENAHGIKSFTLGNHTSTEAKANVILLEEEEVTIYLDGRGFRAGTDSKDVSETLEALLQELSPGFGLKQQQILFTKLTRLQQLE